MSEFDINRKLLYINKWNKMIIFHFVCRKLKIKKIQGKILNGMEYLCVCMHFFHFSSAAWWPLIINESIEVWWAVVTRWNKSNENIRSHTPNVYNVSILQQINGTENGKNEETEMNRKSDLNGPFFAFHRIPFLFRFIFLFSFKRLFF